MKYLQFFLLLAESGGARQEGRSNGLA
jgi:hypothetical protein